eukprot:jgi/Pico_ML_1/52105/g2866.t1
METDLGRVSGGVVSPTAFHVHPTSRSAIDALGRRHACAEHANGHVRAPSEPAHASQDVFLEVQRRKRRRSRVRETTVQDLNAKLSSGQDVVVVDVREPSEYAEGHVPGAENVPLGTVVDAAKEGRFDAYADREVHVICQLGGRSTKACTALAQELRGTKLINVTGGTAEWIQAGFGVEK